MNYKTILFDADGVVIRAQMFSLQYAKEFGISPDDMLPFFKGPFQDCATGKADLKEILPPFLAQWKWHKSVDEFLDYWFQAEHILDRKLIKKIQQLRAQGVLCYLATNQEKYRLHYCRQEMDFDNIFDDIFCSAEMGYKKPQAEFYQYILDYLAQEKHILPSEIAYVDDSEKNIEAAKQLGISAHLYTDMGSFEKLFETK